MVANSGALVQLSSEFVDMKGRTIFRYNNADSGGDDREETLCGPSILYWIRSKTRDTFSETYHSGTVPR